MNPGAISERLAAFSSLPQIQAAIAELLSNYEPIFLGVALRVVFTLAVVRLVCRGVVWSYSDQPFQQELFRTFKLILLIAVTRILIVNYEEPIPFLQISVTNIVTDFSSWMLQTIETEALARSVEHLDQLWQRFSILNPLGLLSNLLLWLVQVLVTIAKACAIGTLAYSLVAAAIGTLLGPLCIPALLVPGYQSVFVQWFKTFLYYNFAPVFVVLSLMVFENVIGQLLVNLPPTSGLNDLFNILVVAMVMACVLPAVPLVTARYLS